MKSYANGFLMISPHVSVHGNDGEDNVRNELFLCNKDQQRTTQRNRGKRTEMIEQRDPLNAGCTSQRKATCDGAAARHDDRSGKRLGLMNLEKLRSQYATQQWSIHDRERQWRFSDPFFLYNVFPTRHLEAPSPQRLRQASQIRSLGACGGAPVNCCLFTSRRPRRAMVTCF